MLAECRKRGWESCDELKDALDCSRRLIENIPNPDELRRLREEEVQKMLHQNPDLTRKKLKKQINSLRQLKKTDSSQRKLSRIGCFIYIPTLPKCF